jgi:hypothetical protein
MGSSACAGGPAGATRAGLAGGAGLAAGPDLATGPDLAAGPDLPGGPGFAAVPVVRCGGWAAAVAGQPSASARQAIANRRRRSIATGSGRRCRLGDVGAVRGASVGIILTRPFTATYSQKPGKERNLRTELVRNLNQKSANCEFWAGALVDISQPSGSDSAHAAPDGAARLIAPG